MQMFVPINFILINGYLYILLIYQKKGVGGRRREFHSGIILIARGICLKYQPMTSEVIAIIAIIAN